MTKALQRWLARTLIVAGALASCCGSAVASAVLTASYRRQHRRALETCARRRDGPGAERRRLTSLGEPIGILEIARIGLSGVVVEGDDEGVLDRAIGHLPDTPLPWQTGNSALAAHRDALFRPLKDVRSGDVLRLRTPVRRFRLSRSRDPDREAPRMCGCSTPRRCDAHADQLLSLRLYRPCAGAVHRARRADSS